VAVTKRLRFEILRRDNHQCRYCMAAMGAKDRAQKVLDEAEALLDG